MVRSCAASPPSTTTILRVSRSLISSRPSRRVARPQGEVSPVRSSVTRGSSAADGPADAGEWVAPFRCPDSARSPGRRNRRPGGAPRRLLLPCEHHRTVSSTAQSDGRSDLKCSDRRRSGCRSRRVRRPASPRPRDRPWAKSISSLGGPTSVTIEEPVTARMVSGAPPSPAEPIRSSTTPTWTRRNQARASSFSRRHIHSSTSGPRSRAVCGASPARRTSSWWMKNSVVLAPSSTPGMAKTENRAGPLRTRSTRSLNGHRCLTSATRRS